MMKIRAVSAALLLTLFACASPAADPQVNGAPSTATSLFERLGGAYAIAAVVDDFIERLLVNDTLNNNPAINQARHRVPAPGLKFHVATLVCQATGGPCKYVGRDMRSSHMHLHISEMEWQAMLAEFNESLDKFKVPSAEKGELVAIVNSTKSEIVAGSGR
jgi:hemoglobin